MLSSADPIKEPTQACTRVRLTATIVYPATMPERFEVLPIHFTAVTNIKPTNHTMKMLEKH